MDLNEFHLMFKKESPLFNSVVLEDLVRKTLDEEKVRHSVRSPTSGRHVSDFESGKQLVTTRANDKSLSVDSGLQSSSSSKKGGLQKSTKRRTLVTCTQRRTNSEALETTTFNPTVISQSSISSPCSSQIAAHAPQSFPARAQEVFLPQPVLQSPKQCWKSKSSISKSIEFSVNESLNDCKQLKCDKGNHNELKSACANSGSQQHYGIWIKNDDEKTLEKNCQSFPTNASQSFFVNKNVSLEHSRILNEIICSCQENCSKDAKEVTSSTSPIAVSKTSCTIPENNSEGKCQKLMSSEKQGQGPNLDHQAEEHNIKSVKQEKKSEPEVGSEDVTANKKPKIITPAEVGKIDKEQLEAIIGSLVKANQHFTEFPRHDAPEKETLIQKQNKYCERNPNQNEDKESIRSKVLEHTVKYIEMRITESVRFAKKIPGFLDLPLEDQANLIRESRTESGIVGGMRGINPDKQVFSTLHGSFFSLEDMKLVFGETLLKEKILLSKKISELRMSLEEEAILRAMTITATDRCPLQRIDIVEDIQNKLLSCLLHVISERDPDHVAQRLGKLFDVLMCCRNVTEVDMKQVKKILLEWPAISSYKLAEEFL